MTAFVRGVSIARTESGSIFWLTRSTSAKTGVAPAATTQLADAKKLRAGTITSSPGPTPSARSASSRASVPLASDMACGMPQKLRSEEHTSELQSLMRISYAVFCLKKKKNKQYTNNI